MESTHALKFRLSTGVSKIIKILFLFGLIYTSYSCSTLILHKMDLKKGYNISEKNKVGIYTIPSEDQEVNEGYSNALQLYFLAKGYDVQDVNLLLEEHSDSVPETRLRRIAEYLKTRDYLNSQDIFVISEIEIDSAFYATTLDEGINRIYYGYYVPRISTDLAIFDRSIDEPVFSYGAIDTAKLYSYYNNNSNPLMDVPWMIAGKQFVKYLDQIPDCSTQRNSDGVKKIKVNFWVDKSYRNTFPNVWQEKINRVAHIAGNIIRNQLGIEMQVAGLIKWDSEFESSISRSYEKLQSKSFSNLDVIRVGVTYDGSLAVNITDRVLLGLAGPMEGIAVFTAKPSFPGMGYWNPVEEAITLVHEIAHCFGAIHIDHSNFLMYPHTNKLAYRIDSFNKQLFQSLISDYFVENDSQRTQRYIKTIIEADKSNYKNGSSSLSMIAKIVFDYYSNESQSELKTEQLHTLIQSVIPDPSYALAVMGISEFELRNWNKSIEYLTKSISLNPNLYEVEWYLKKAYEKAGNNEEAKGQKNSSASNRNK